MTNLDPQLAYHQASAADHFPPHVEKIIDQAHLHHRALVLVTGVFDLLHQEHITFLTKAKAAGDVLVVGVESDARVKELKGESRPINSDLVRRQKIEDLHLADVVFILPDAFSTPDEYRRFTHHVHPDILAVSSHTNFQERKDALMKEVGGSVLVVHEHNPKISTTLLLEQKSRII